MSNRFGSKTERTMKTCKLGLTSKSKYMNLNTLLASKAGLPTPISLL